jgi:hypothetical protein
MCNYLSAGSSVLGANSYIMIALNPEAEKPSAPHHLIVGLLIVRISFHVVQVISEIAAAKPQDKVEDIGDHKHGDASTL